MCIQETSSCCDLPEFNYCGCNVGRIIFESYSDLGFSDYMQTDLCELHKRQWISQTDTSE